MFVSITTFSTAKCGLSLQIYNYNQNLTITPVGGGLFYSNLVVINYGDSLLFSVNAGGCNPPTWCDLDSVSWSYNGNQVGPILNDLCQVNFIIQDTGLYVAHYILDGTFPIQSNIDVIYNSYTTGIASVKNINFLNVFPTTVNSSINIHLNSIKTNDIEISFSDMNGKQLKNDFYKNVIGEFIKNENTEALARGIYFIRMKAGDEVLNRKFVKM